MRQICLMSVQDDQTEIGEIEGIPYTREHVEGKPTPSGDYYRVTCAVELIDRPNHKNTYFVPVFRLNEFFEDHPSGDDAEEIVDVEPVSEPEKDAMIDEYRQNDSETN